MYRICFQVYIPAGTSVSISRCFASYHSIWIISGHVTEPVQTMWALWLFWMLDYAILTLCGRKTGSTLTEKQRVSTTHSLDTFSFKNYIAYILYPPLYIGGPIITFNDFMWQVSLPPRAASRMPIQISAYNSTVTQLPSHCAQCSPIHSVSWSPSLWWSWFSISCMSSLSKTWKHGTETRRWSSAWLVSGI